MSKSLTQIGQEKFNENYENFSKKIKDIISNYESPLDETTIIKVYFNISKDYLQYFKFQIITMRNNYTSDYYEHDYSFTEGNINNVDEISSYQDEVEIFSYFGNEI